MSSDLSSIPLIPWCPIKSSYIESSAFKPLNKDGIIKTVTQQKLSQKEEDDVLKRTLNWRVDRRRAYNEIIEKSITFQDLPNLIDLFKNVIGKFPLREHAKKKIENEALLAQLMLLPLLINRSEGNFNAINKALISEVLAHREYVYHLEFKDVALEMTDNKLRAFLLAFPHIRSLDLSDCVHLTSHALKEVVQLKKLKTLSLNQTHGIFNDDVELEYIPGVENLRVLDISGLTISKQAMNWLGKCKKLQTVCVEDSTVEQALFEGLVLSGKLEFNAGESLNIDIKSQKPLSEMNKTNQPHSKARRMLEYP